MQEKKNWKDKYVQKEANIESIWSSQHEQKLPKTREMQYAWRRDA